MKTKYDNVFVNPYLHETEKTPIAFDLDSVLNTIGHDIGEGIAKAYNVPFESVRCVDPVHGFELFHFSPPGVDDYNGVAKVVNKIIMEESPSSLPTPFMAATMRYVHEVTGKPVAVITARNPMTVGVTYRWLLENLEGVPFRAYIMHGIPKYHPLLNMGSSIFVDDRWKTIKTLLDYIEYPVMYKRPWNQGRDKQLPVLEVRDTRDIIPLLNIKLGRVPTEWPSYVPFPKREE